MKSQKDNYVICIGRQLGSGGREVALGISKALGISFYDKEIIMAAAKESGLAPECFERSDEKPSHSLLGGLSGRGLPFYSCDMMGTETFLCSNNLFRIQSDTINSLADRGPAVFVGRCADYILRDRKMILSVFITASLQDRISRIMKLENLSEEEASSRIFECDRKRAEYYNYYTFKEWGSASSYDLCLNTSVIGLKEATEKIVSLVKEKFAL